MTRDRVTPELWQAVMERDKGCVLARLDPSHRCSGYMTVEHVKSDLRMGKRAPSDLAHLVAMCYGGNVGVPSKTQRAALREYLKDAALLRYLEG